MKNRTSFDTIVRDALTRDISEAAASGGLLGDHVAFPVVVRGALGTLDRHAPVHRSCSAVSIDAAVRGEVRDGSIHPRGPLDCYL